MKPEEYWKKVLEFNDKYFPDWRKSHIIFMSNALAGESGELSLDVILSLLLTAKVGSLCNMIKHYIGGGTSSATNTVTREDILLELVDLDIYKILAVEGLGFTEQDFVNAMDKKLQENIKRMEEKKKNDRGK